MSYGRTRAALLAAAFVSFAACGGGSKQAEPAAPAPAAAAPADGTAAAPADGTAATPADGTAKPADATAGNGAKVTDADMEKAVAMFEEMAKAAKANVGDCDAQAAGMQKVVDDNKDFIARMKGMEKDPDADKRFQEKYGERVQTTMMGMMSDLQKCQDNENVKKVFQEMQQQ